MVSACAEALGQQEDLHLAAGEAPLRGYVGDGKGRRSMDRQKRLEMMILMIGMQTLLQDIL